MSPQTITPGLLALHGNRSEELAEVVVQWLLRHPLGPLESEIILVQSNGMAEWVKMELARLGQVCAATQVELPARFLWRTFRQVLGADAVPPESALDKLPMTWRLMALLPGLVSQDEFLPVAGFLQRKDAGGGDLGDFSGDRLWQLASRLADLFDQYQIYRADWLHAWEQGRDVLLDAAGRSLPLAADQLWQPALWRAVLGTLLPHEAQATRPRLQQRMLARLQSEDALPPAVARRVVVFGMSHMPLSTLQTLAALSQHRQVLLALPNPCRYHWGDIMDGRELLASLRRRQGQRPGPDLSTIALQDMHAHAHPLLAAWGRQGRDFIRQLDVFDDAEQAQGRFGAPRMDFFDQPCDEAGDVATLPLLAQVQAHIRDMRPLAEHPPCELPALDRSIVFHTAHSKVRELEVLHDQLLHAFANAPLDQPLQPRDVVVMVPDIAPLAPAIRAVFGQYKRGDRRYIPFDIADLSAKSASPIVGAVDWLMQLPQQRCTMSELVALLEVPALAARFGIAPESLPRLTLWMVAAGIRWGLNDAHRQDLGLGACGSQNSAWFGLQRMLMGYAAGVVAHADFERPGHIEPFADLGGLEAELAGCLAHLLQSLLAWWDLARVPAQAEDWAARCTSLMQGFFKPVDDADRATLLALADASQAWRAACDGVYDHTPVPLSVARSAWMDALEVPALNQRFRAGGVTFCTLMPMRAIPFEVVCLLGMNDGDYPRASLRSDFDLMGQAGQARPGDRSRRQDDRQLMLEALLSARRLLYVSWCGRSVRDNSEQPPSVLVSQLRDYLAQGWGQAAVHARTTHHPLQPFSRLYFEEGSGLSTFAREWRAAHSAHSSNAVAATATTEPPQVIDANDATPLTLARLIQFLRNPVKAYFRHQLGVVFDDLSAEQADDECFELAGLDNYQLMQELLEPWSGPGAQAASAQHLAQALQRQQAAGRLPLAGMGVLERDRLATQLGTMLAAWQRQTERFAQPADRLPVQHSHQAVLLQDWLEPLRRANNSDTSAADPALPMLARLTLEPGRLLQTGSKPAARPEKLVSAWVYSLASAVSGQACLSVLVGRDGTVMASPMEESEARLQLDQLLDLWRQGQAAPLPLPLKTALAQALGKDAAEEYEGDGENAGEGAEACLARLYPDFDALTLDGRFDALTAQIYAPFLGWMRDHVSAEFHAAPMDDEA
jgi:exodeoxyribonuclease V gamma subunit